MARKSSRTPRRLRELMDSVAELDRASAARWVIEHRIKFDEYAGWHHTSEGVLARALQNGGCVMVLDGPAGWYITDNLGRTFAPCNPLPTEFRGCARRHDDLVFFADEESARLAAHKLPGYWCDPTGEPSR